VEAAHLHQIPSGVSFNIVVCFYVLLVVSKIVFMIVFVRLLFFFIHFSQIVLIHFLRMSSDIQRLGRQTRHGNQTSKGDPHKIDDFVYVPQYLGLCVCLCKEVSCSLYLFFLCIFINTLRPESLHAQSCGR
jgi:hypothetical protein